MRGNRRLQLGDAPEVEERKRGLFQGEDEELDPEEVRLAAVAAIKTLIQLGYTYEGGELWRPPLGPRRGSIPIGYGIFAEVVGEGRVIQWPVYARREDAIAAARQFTPGTRLEIRPVYAPESVQPALETAAPAASAAPSTPRREVWTCVCGDHNIYPPRITCLSCGVGMSAASAVTGAPRRLG